MNSDIAKHIEILLVEDNEGDVFLTRKAFEKAKISNTISVAIDGEIALKKLRREDEFADYTLPDIVVLDINLPKKDGMQVLTEMKQDENLRRIPVVILTSSQAEQDVLKTYDLHASGYVVKPLNFEKFVEVVAAVEDFWFSIVTLPSKV